MRHRAASLDTVLRAIDEGRYNETATALGRLLEARPDDTASLCAQAVVRHRLAELDGAFESCERALSVAPGAPVPMLVRGALLAERGDRVSALDCYRRVAKQWPQRQAARYLVRTAGGGGFEAPLRGEVEALFDRVADHFEEHILALGYRGHEAVARAAIDALGGEAPIEIALDLGCGSGLCGPLLRPFTERLIGVDLSARIAAQARRRGVYDAVFVADLVYALLTTQAGAVDLCVAADVLGYVGGLEPVLEEAERVLRPGGHFAFTVEAWLGGDGYRLGSGRRFQYAEGYIRDAAEASGLAVTRLDRDQLRREGEVGVAGLVVVLERSGDSSD